MAVKAAQPFIVVLKADDMHFSRRDTKLAVHGQSIWPLLARTTSSPYDAIGASASIEAQWVHGVAGEGSGMGENTQSQMPSLWRRKVQAMQ